MLTHISHHERNISISVHLSAAEAEDLTKATDRGPDLRALIAIHRAIVQEVFRALWSQFRRDALAVTQARKEPVHV